MTNSQKRSLMIVFTALAFLILIGYAAYPQTLQHHAEPSELKPQSCRDHVAQTRHEFLDAAQWTDDQEFKDNLAKVYVRTGDIKYVAHVCSNEKLIRYYNVLVDLAIYDRRQNMLQKKVPITH